MKKTFLKITTCLLFMAATLGTATLARAQDSSMAPAAAPASPTKFNGPVTAVDTNAMTFKVGDQTFTVTSESFLSKDGKPATLSEAVVGEPAHGSYITGADGKLNVKKASFGKKAAKAAKSNKKKKSKSKSTDSNTGTTNTDMTVPAAPAAPADSAAPAPAPAPTPAPAAPTAPASGN